MLLIDETIAVGTLLTVKDVVLYLRNLDTLLTESSRRFWPPQYTVTTSPAS